ncbi:BlaR1 family beta-lactam sensor/signal transducer [Virgibacillus oceani]|uniref:BlaR1 family beta-lactam sensor/signal transducer n=1 Tax=Virgibacillus oceani TaxID=1479511 RepID=A0A917MAI8_9BACI|nr:BlaR1 family beta-lactam sensor/signal transducer [Virgibacillus oceani]GGG87980.1 BlaR1 family beta-lactam sensor/signal transducer [Virgibacillus oceani]
MTFTNFVISFIVSSFTIGIIMLLKKIFHKQLSAKWQYNLWYFLLFALTLPFLPNDLINIGSHFNSPDSNQSYNLSPSSAATVEAHGNNLNWMRDFTLSVQRFSPEFLNSLTAGIWILGMIILIVLTIHAWLTLNTIRSTTSQLKNKKVLQLFVQCKKELNISGKLIVGESRHAKSPMTFGLLKTYVVLPKNFDEWLSMEDIKYIFLHELNHYKYKDITTNYLMVIFQILYWFNPLVWFAFREMKLDREIACDNAVLHSLEEDCYAKYGNTIINFADKSSKLRGFALANQLNGSKEQLKKRIQRIAAFSKESKLLKMKSIAVFMLVGALVFTQIPLVTVMAGDNDRYDFNSERVMYEDLNNYFNDYAGSFVMYDKHADQYHIYNKDQSELRVSPDSTYKIYSALFGLESSIITTNNTTLKWDGEQYPYTSWNTDQDLTAALTNSVNWYFQELDKRLELDTIKENLRKIDYGNYDVSGGVKQFWLESSLKISPIEQVQLLKNFYTNQFGFQEKNVQTIKNALLLEEKNGARLSGKTGTGTVNGKQINGWFIGYVETGNNTYFFAANIQNENKSSGSKAAEITLSILNDKGIY